MHKVENLKTKFANQINIVGIVSEELESARKLIEKKGITFANIIGNSQLKASFEINSWPRYLLIDQSGIVRKEYFGFSDQIDVDITKMLGI